jgi:Leucine-rich repeat (LRR) protein
VSNNFLTSLPDAIGNMEQLESLHAANNHIRDLPTSFFSLKNLTFLDLSSNKLRQLSDGIGQLTQLHSLLLYDNRLRLIPDSISMLKHLTTLWLGRNRLRTLPRSLTQLKQLDWKHNYLSTILDENPLLNPPLSVCVLGFTAINKWHQQDSSIGVLNLDGVQQSNDGQSSIGDGSTSRLPIQRSPHFFN